MFSFLFFSHFYNKESEDEEEEKEEEEDGEMDRRAELKVEEIKQVHKEVDVKQTSPVEIQEKPHIPDEAKASEVEVMKEQNDRENTVTENDELRKSEVLNKEELDKDLEDVPEIKIFTVQDDAREESREEFSGAVEDLAETNSQSAINKSEVTVSDISVSKDNENDVKSSQVEDSGDDDSFAGKALASNHDMHE